MCDSEDAKCDENESVSKVIEICMDQLCRGEIRLLSIAKVIDVPCSSGEYLSTERDNRFFKGSRLRK